MLSLRSLCPLRVGDSEDHRLCSMRLRGVVPFWPRLGRLGLPFHATYLVLLPQTRKNVLDTPVLSPPSTLDSEREGGKTPAQSRRSRP